jgi:hypothetical protein
MPRPELVLAGAPNLMFSKASLRDSGVLCAGSPLDKSRIPSNAGISLRATRVSA